MYEKGNKKESANFIVTGTGTAIADFDYAIFTATAQAHGKTSREAKNKAKESIDALQKLLDRWSQDGIIHEIVTFFEVNPFWVHSGHSRTQDGYAAEYTLRFTTRKLAEVDSIHDALTEAGENISVLSPEYRLDNLKKYESQALDAAWLDAIAQMKHQCALASRTESKLESKICWWNVAGNEVWHGKSERSGAVKIVAGKAHIKATVHIGFLLDFA